MNLVDKLLLGSLILLLPIGLVVSFFLVKDSGVSTAGTVEGSTIDASKLEALIVDTVKKNQTVPATPKPILITEVSFASESATLKLNGAVPVQSTSVMVSATVLPRPEDQDQLNPEEKVKGTQVDTVSVIPEKTGAFTYEYVVDKKQINNIVELRIEQDESVVTVKFDLKQKKQIL